MNASQTGSNIYNLRAVPLNYLHQYAMVPNSLVAFTVIFEEELWKRLLGYQTKSYTVSVVFWVKFSIANADFLAIQCWLFLHFNLIHCFDDI